MRPSVWESTLEGFRNEVASSRPVPAAACVSAVAASLALNLLMKVLEITANRKGFAGDREKLKALASAAKAAAAQLAGYADEDVAAFDAYLESIRLPKSTEEECDKRGRAIAATLDRAIQVPLASARSASSGIDLCTDAAALAPQSLVGDLAAAVALLAGSVRAFIVSAEFNVRQLADEPRAYDDVIAELRDLDSHARRHEDSMRRQVASLIAIKDQKPGLGP